MSYVDPTTVHVPGTGAAIPAAWGTTVNSDLNDLNTRALVTKIAETVLGASAGSVTFSSIPNTFRHLRLEWQARGDTAAVNTALQLQVNGDTSASYDRQSTQIVGTVVSASEAQGLTAMLLGLLAAASASANTPGTGTIDIPNYAGTVFVKHALTQTVAQAGVGSGALTARFDLGSYRATTSAINALKLFPAAGNFVAGSTFTLYGIS